MKCDEPVIAKISRRDADAMKAKEVMIECKFNLAQDGEAESQGERVYIFVTEDKKVICVLYMIGTSGAAYNKHLHEFEKSVATPKIEKT
jgi:hypothetical protein